MKVHETEHAWVASEIIQVCGSRLMGYNYSSVSFVLTAGIGQIPHRATAMNMLCSS